MTKKMKLILLLIFAIIILLICFLFWKNKAFAPHTISIQNSDNASPVATEPSQSEPDTTKDTTESITNITDPKKVTEKPVATPKPAEAEQKIADYKLQIAQRLVSWGFSKAMNRKIDTIIIHSSYNALGGDEYDTTKLIAEYKEYGVAPHYLIDRKGKIYQLVEEKNIAYHAGESKTPDGRTQVNNFSLGIELMNTKDDKYTSEQYSALNSLLSTLKSKYSIKYVLGHNDIAPGRKTDPWNFEWKKITK